MPTKHKNTMVLCAHSDDQIFGVGGTIAKYASNGWEVFTVIFSHGERSHPWLKRNVIAAIRVKEAQEADQIIGGNGVIFLGVKDHSMYQFLSGGIKDRKVIRRIAELIRKRRPQRIFTHSPDDPHPDHRAVYHASMAAVERSGVKCDLFSFDVWNLLGYKKRLKPVMYVDISNTFSIKIRALGCFKSQTFAMLSLLWSIYLKG
ncbi:TPA: PIG-L family deacetylase, partial [Candidatus Woesearchaeota archaeon]|nr:PIG-L family deacetylase [Candidatus Woesearchaeota archaeon]